MLLDNDAVIQFRLPSSLKKTLTKRAKKRGLNISALLRDAIYEFLALHPVEGIYDANNDGEVLDNYYTFRVSTDLRTSYLHSCEREGIKPPAPLRKAMQEVIKKHHKRLKDKD